MRFGRPRRAILAALGSTTLALTAAVAFPQERDPAPLQRPATDLYEPRILASDATFDYPAIGEILRADAKGPAGHALGAGRCSAALVGCKELITSARCIRALQAAGTGGLSVFFQHAGFLPIPIVRIPDRYDRVPVAQGLASYIDVAVVELAEPVSGIAPLALARPGEPLPSRAVLVSFGSSETDPLLAGGVEPGIKRATAMTVEPCPDELRTPGEVPAFVCAQSLVAGRALESDTGFLVGEHGEIIGIHSVSRPSSSGRVRSAAVAVVNSPVYEFATRRISRSKAERCDASGTGRAGSSVVERLDRCASGDFVAYPLDVPPGTDKLRVTLNAAGSATSEPPEAGYELTLYRPGTFDATAKQENSALPTRGAACRSARPAIALSCEQLQPTVGRWFAVVRNAGRAGPFQLTAGLFGNLPTATGSCTAKVSVSGPSSVKHDALAVYRADYDAVADQQARVELVVPRGLLVDPERIFPRSGVIAYRDGTTIVSWLRAQVPAGKVQIATRADPSVPVQTADIAARLLEEQSGCTAIASASVEIAAADDAAVDDAAPGRQELVDPMDRPVGWTYYTPSATPSSAGPEVAPPHESLLSGSPPLENR